MAKVSFYENFNGRVNQGSREIPDFTFNDVMNDLFYGTGDIFTKALDVIPARTNKQICPVNFPPSNTYVDGNTKEWHTDIAVCGITENDLRVELDNDKVIVYINKDAEDLKDRLYASKGLKLVKEAVLPYSFDPRFHDVATLDVKLANGILSLSMLPREEVKPIKKTVFGNLKEQKPETKKKQKLEE